jgi:kinesin family member C2/C3
MAPPRGKYMCRYEFDRVFAPNDTQEAVYEDVSDLIVSVADGYNVCIMAYGQTGSGKTYTMQGVESNPGINMRALKELFQIGEDRKESLRMQVQASIVEIYNDSIYDLLSESPRHTGDRLEIKEVGCLPRYVYLVAFGKGRAAVHHSCMHHWSWLA